MSDRPSMISRFKEVLKLDFYCASPPLWHLYIKWRLHLHFRMAFKTQVLKSTFHHMCLWTCSGTVLLCDYWLRSCFLRWVFLLLLIISELHLKPEFICYLDVTKHENSNFTSPFSQIYQKTKQISQVFSEIALHSQTYLFLQCCIRKVWLSPSWNLVLMEHLHMGRQGLALKYEIPAK